jgi:hypothetical protein
MLHLQAQNRVAGICVIEAIFKAETELGKIGLGVITMQRRFIIASILCLALALPCMAQSSEPKPESGKFGEINVLPVKDLIGKIVEMCNSGRSDQAMSSFSVTIAFEVDQNGSIPVSSIKITTSSGSKEVDRLALQVLWLLGESHVLGLVSGPPVKTIQVKLADNVSHLAIMIPAATPEEARAKSEQLRFLLEIVRMSQKSKNPSVSELLNSLVVKSEDKGITTDLALPCSRSVELLRMLNNK